jgi:DNA-binding MarR family transcriptional regulator
VKRARATGCQKSLSPPNDAPYLRDGLRPGLSKIPSAQIRAHAERELPPNGARPPRPRIVLSVGVLSSYLSVNLRRAHYEVFAEATRALQRIDLTPGQFTILVVIEQNAALKQIDIATAAGIKKANLAHALALLEKRGLITRKMAPVSGRFRYLAITARGRALLVRARYAVETVETRVTECLPSVDDKTNLIRQLKAIASAFPYREGTVALRRLKA